MITTKSEEQQAQTVPVVLTAPIGEELAGQIAAAYPDRIELHYRPELMPPSRYIGDYHGDYHSWKQTSEQEAAWREVLARAEVLFDFDDLIKEHPLTLSPSLRWVQTTSAGVGQLVRRLGMQDSDVIVTTASGVPFDSRGRADATYQRRSVGEWQGYSTS